jgi:spore coat protein A
MTPVSWSRRQFFQATATAAAAVGLASCTPGGTRDSAGFDRDSAGLSPDAALLNAGLHTIASQLSLPPPFQVPLPIPRTLTPQATVAGDYYDIVQSEASVEIIPGLQTRIWGYNGTFPGPTIVSMRGRQTVVRHRNQLPVPTVVHLHGGQIPADEDGYATDYILPMGMTAAPAMPGMPGMADPDATVSHVERTYTYPMQQRAATLWYHDHRMGFTGASVYRGLAGFHIVHDDEELSLPLPKGERDIPLMICDRSFAADGSFLYPSIDTTLLSTPGVEPRWFNGVMGDVILVNGAPWPTLTVGAGRYRFRILNAANARTFQLALSSPAGPVVFTQIGTDGGLLSAPLDHTSLVIGSGQRMDTVIDFGRFKAGDEITLTNQAGTDHTAAVMRFVVGQDLHDTTAVPSSLSTVDGIDLTRPSTRRTMDFRYDSGQWTINGHGFAPHISQATVKGGTTEQWTITSGDGNHPVHLHGADLQVISRDSRPPGAYDAGWKDTVLVGPDESVQLAVRFHTYPGRYMVHCHNLEHEDMAMMANFHVTT